MSLLRSRRLCALLGAGALSGAMLVTSLPLSAGADTDPTALVGEGGSFLTPVTDVLLKADAGLAPLNPQYQDADIDQGIADFVGTGPGHFNADFAVTERPLTSAEAATAKTNGRTFAYVPFAATPVAIATLAVCSPAGVQGNSTSALCQGIPLNTEQTALLFTQGLTNPSVSPNQNLPLQLSGWQDPRLTLASGQPIPGAGVYQASTLQPSAENTALMAYLDSDPTAKELFDNALNNPVANPLTSSDSPSEKWPFHGLHAAVGGDAGLIERELNINAETNAPSTLNSWTGLSNGADDVFPVASVWAGAPQGTPWNIPTAAIENAAGKFVVPSAAAAGAAEADATMDPTTRLVTFVANLGDQVAYNNYLMVESYLVVPTSGLSADKAAKLAQFIRFITGPVAQSDEATVGSAPPTTAMVAADQKVATELDTEAATAASTTSNPTTTTTITSATTTTTTVPVAAVSTAAAGNAGNSGGSSGLASTGAPDNIVPVLAAGGALVVLGAFGRRRLRRLRQTEARS